MSFFENLNQLRKSYQEFSNTTQTNELTFDQLIQCEKCLVEADEFVKEQKLCLETKRLLMETDSKILEERLRNSPDGVLMTMHEIKEDIPGFSFLKFRLEVFEEGDCCSIYSGEQDDIFKLIKPQWYQDITSGLRLLGNKKHFNFIREIEDGDGWVINGYFAYLWFSITPEMPKNNVGLKALVHKNSQRYPYFYVIDDQLINGPKINHAQETKNNSNPHIMRCDNFEIIVAKRSDWPKFKGHVLKQNDLTDDDVTKIKKLLREQIKC